MIGHENREVVERVGGRARSAQFPRVLGKPCSRGGVLFASIFAVIGDIFPIEQWARVSAVFGARFGLSSVIGPKLGGYLTDGAGWRWVFYVNVPLGVLAVVLVAFVLPFMRSRAQL